jgi:guanylate kinase
VADGGFEEHTEFAGTGHLYGTPSLDRGADADVVLEIDVDGARQVRSRHPDALVVLIVAPSKDVQEARLRARGDDEEHIRRRLDMAAKEETDGRSFADAVVVNDDVDRAAGEVAGILASVRGRYRRAPLE